MAVLTLSNILSLLRGPLALLFLPHITELRVAVLLLAALTDYLDGFFARTFKSSTQLGAVLDPLMDKLFIFTVLAVLLSEQTLTSLAALAILGRDLCLIAFGLFVLMRRGIKDLPFRSFWWGKVITVSQYVVLGLVIIGFPLHPYIYLAFLGFTVLYLGELVVYYREAT